MCEFLVLVFQGTDGWEYIAPASDRYAHSATGKQLHRTPVRVVAQREMTGWSLRDRVIFSQSCHHQLIDSCSSVSQPAHRKTFYQTRFPPYKVSQCKPAAFEGDPEKHWCLPGNSPTDLINLLWQNWGTYYFLVAEGRRCGVFWEFKN